MVISRIASGLVSSGRVFGCNHQILSVRTHWWGHETLGKYLCLIGGNGRKK